MLFSFRLFLRADEISWKRIEIYVSVKTFLRESLLATSKFNVLTQLKLIRFLKKYFELRDLQYGVEMFPGYPVDLGVRRKMSLERVTLVEFGANITENRP